MGTWVIAQRTPLNASEVASLVRAELVRAGIDPVRALPLALAQLDVETGTFRSIYNFNIGNLKPGRSWPGNWYTVKVSERDAAGNLVWYSPAGRLSGKHGEPIAEHYTVPPGHPQTRFRAYDTAAEGVSDWARLLVAPRFAEGRQGLEAGDGEAFIRGLKNGGYFTATFSEYFKAFSERLPSYVDASQKRGNSGRGGAGFLVGLLLLGGGGFFLSRARKGSRR